MAKNNSQEEPLRGHIRLLIGFIVGSGGAGALAMMREAPDLRPWGVGLFALCIFAVVFLLWLGEWLVDRQERRHLKRLGDAYAMILNTTGQRLVDKLEIESARGRLQPSEMRIFVLETLAQLLQSQSRQRLGNGEESEWVQVFRESIQNTVNEWTVLAAVEQKEGHFPPDATPEKI